jgi:hypothetical protein
MPAWSPCSSKLPINHWYAHTIPAAQIKSKCIVYRPMPVHQSIREGLFLGELPYAADKLTSAGIHTHTHAPTKTLGSGERLGARDCNRAWNQQCYLCMHGFVSVMISQSSLQKAERPTEVAPRLGGRQYIWHKVALPRCQLPRQFFNKPCIILASWHSRLSRRADAQT